MMNFEFGGRGMGEDIPIDSEKERYFRQIILFGKEKQQRLRNTHVFIAGCGGLGSPIAMYLTAAGVGTLTIVDNDKVSLSNLNRQLLHWTSDIGKDKAISAQEKLSRMNPEVRVRCIPEIITDNTIESLSYGADLIIDAVDSMQTRQILNRFVVITGIPFIHGAVHGMSGQMMVILPGLTACLRCVMKEELQKPGPIPVLGTTAGIIGTMQANEAIKIITGEGTVQAGKMIIWDGNRGTLEILKTQRNSSCPVCGR